MTQSQAALEDQLNELDTLAAKHGLYDAQDFLRQVRASLKRKRVESAHGKTDDPRTTP